MSDNENRKLNFFDREVNKKWKNREFSHDTNVENA